MGKVLIGVLIGVLLGGALVFFLFGGVPRAAKTPGEPIKGPDASTPAASAQLVLRQEFFNGVIGAIFAQGTKPSFPLGLAQNEFSNSSYEYAAFQQCDGQITILPEGSGVKTGVRFDNDKISAPLAFTGSYNSPFGCLNFTGWAQAALELRFDKSQQALYGRVNVETVNLDGVNPAISGFVTPMVQNSLNQRVNPIQILSGKQVSVNVPIASTGGNLNASVSDMRAEFKDGALNLFVIYDMTGGQSQTQQTY